MSYILSKKLYQPLEQIEKSIDKFLNETHSEKKHLKSEYNILEYRRLQEFLSKAFLAIKAKSKTEQELFKIVAQVAHDIRSPLNTLMITADNSDNLSDKERLIIKQVVDRITNISTSILSQYRNPQQQLSINLFNTREELVTNYIREIIAEKKVQVSPKKIKFKFELAEASHTAFVNINADEFKRLLSNVITNAIESIANEGVIDISLEVVNKKLQLKIADNGRGIPTELLDKITKGISHGKSNGYGLGLTHAVQCINAWKGSYKIKSKLGQGTKFIIDLPIVVRPEWIPDNLNAAKRKPVVLIANNLALQTVIQKKLTEIPTKPKVKFLNFNSYDDFLKNYNNNKNKFKECCLLIDHGLNQQQSCLDLIADLDSSLGVYLLVPTYPDDCLQQRALDFHVKILPEYLLPHILFHLS